MIALPTWLAVRDDIGPDMKYWYLCLRMEAKAQGETKYQVQAAELLIRYHIPMDLVEHILEVLGNYRLIEWTPLETDPVTYEIEMQLLDGPFTPAAYLEITADDLNTLIKNHLGLATYDCREYDGWESGTEHAISINPNFHYDNDEREEVQNFLQHPTFSLPVRLLLSQLALENPDVFPWEDYLITCS